MPGTQRHRRLGADEDELLDAGEERDDLLSEIGQALDNDAAGAELGSWGERVAQQPRAGLCLDAARRFKRVADERRPAHQDRRPPAVRQQARDALHHGGRRARRRDVGQSSGCALGRAPRAIGGQDSAFFIES